MSQYLNNVSITNTSVSSIALLTITPLKSKIPLSLYAIVQKSHKTFFNYNNYIYNYSYIKHSNWGLLKKKPHGQSSISNSAEISFLLLSYFSSLVEVVVVYYCSSVQLLQLMFIDVFWGEV